MKTSKSKVGEKPCECSENCHPGLCECKCHKYNQSPINKTQVINQLKGMYNSTKEINGVLIRRRCWDKNTWQIVDSLDFETGNVIKDFYYQKDLAEEIIKHSS